MNSFHQKMSALLLSVAAVTILSQAQKQPVKQRQDLMIQAIKIIKPSVVQIIARIDENELIVGSGFFVNEDGLVLTASHVADVFEAIQRSQGRVKQVYVGIAWPNPKEHGFENIEVIQSFHLIPFTVLARDRVHDVAILKAAKNPFDKSALPILFKQGDKELRLQPKFAILSASPLEDGDELAFSGYPLHSNFLVSLSATVANARITLNDAELRGLGLEPAQDHDQDFIAVGALINQGHSGSPLFDMSGHVVGICEGHVRAPVLGEQQTPGPGQQLWSNAGIGLVVPVKYAVDLMRRNNVRWHSANEGAARNR